MTTTTGKKLFAVLDMDMVVLATFAEVEEALAEFEKNDEAITVVRTNRALTPGRKCWMWAQTITQSVEVNEVDCPKFEPAGGKVGTAPYNEGQEYDLCKCGAPCGNHKHEVIKAAGINL